MYIPKYSISSTILRNIGFVEAAREVIENAPLVPAWEAKFRDEARLRAVHYGTALEGNDLTFQQAKSLMENRSEEVVAKDRDIQEVLNYRKVLDFIERQEKSLNYSVPILLQIHKLITDKIIPD